MLDTMPRICIKVASFTFNRFCRVNWMAHGHPVYINTIDFFIYTSRLKSRLNKDAVASMLHRVSMYPRNNFRYFDRGTYLDRMYSQCFRHCYWKSNALCFRRIIDENGAIARSFRKFKITGIWLPPLPNTERLPNSPFLRFGDQE